MIDVGRGVPIVLIPGIQGRWEWMGPTVRALALRHRVITFSLDDVPPPPEPTRMFDAWIAHIDALLDRAHAPRAIVVGVSFGGLIATRYAARRPARTAGLVLVSTPSPRPELDAQAQGYLRYPRLAMPFFAGRGIKRLIPETITARLTWTSRARFLTGHISRMIRAPFKPRHMAFWVRAWMATDLAADCRLVTAPTLVITGEPALDQVVPVRQTLEFCTHITGATHRVFRRPGHIGFVSRPLEFADMITAFIRDHWREASGAPAIGRAG